jgi:hypothetical protein
VRAAAQVDEIALAVKSNRLFGGDVLDDLRLVFLAHATKQLDRLVTVPDLARDFLVALHDLLHALRDRLEIILGKWFVSREVVIEAVLDRGPYRHLGLRPEFLYGLGQHMRRIVAQQLEPILGISLDDLDGCIVFDRSGQVPELAVDPDRDRLLCQALRYVTRDLGSGDRIIEFPFGSVWQLYGWHLGLEAA